MLCLVCLACASVCVVIIRRLYGYTYKYSTQYIHISIAHSRSNEQISFQLNGKSSNFVSIVYCGGLPAMCYGAQHTHTHKRQREIKANRNCTTTWNIWRNSNFHTFVFIFERFYYCFMFFRSLRNAITFFPLTRRHARVSATFKANPIVVAGWLGDDVALACSRTHV